MSINLCTDQLLMALAEPRQIAAVSRWARHGDMSFLADRAQTIPVVRGLAEEVLRLAPDLVLAGTFSGLATRAVLQQQGLRVESFAPPRNLPEARAEIERAARLLGRPAAGVALLADIDSAQRDARAAPARPVFALALQRRGYASGRDTLLSDLMGHAGLGNAAERLGIATVERASLEAIVKARPDALVVDDASGRSSDQGTALLRHPALSRAVPAARWIELPALLTTCAGPSLSAALRRLAAGADRIKALPSYR